MKVIFSRKGFDLGTGKRPSPIMDGKPVSLPIPGENELHSFNEIYHPHIGDLTKALQLVKAPHKPTDLAHYDPQIPASPGLAALGQGRAAQAHLDNQAVGIGDVFLFFGLFKDYGAPQWHPNAKPHHRIFGYLKVNEVFRLGPNPSLDSVPPHIHRGLPVHPHIHRQDQAHNNTLWVGDGCLAHTACDDLRLSHKLAIPSLWTVPTWLADAGLSYHASPARWDHDTLLVVSRGQEFVTGDLPPEGRAWLNHLITTIEAAGNAAP